MKTGILTSAAIALALSTMSVSCASAAKPAEITPPAVITNSDSAQAAELSSVWIDGRRQEMTGLVQIKDGEKLIKKAQKSERKAAEKLTKANATSNEQRAAYTRLVAGFGQAAMPYAVETEIKALKKAADDWKDAYQQVEKAGANLKQAQAELAAGQSSVRTGDELVAAGRAKMRRAEVESAPGYIAPVANDETTVDGL